MVTLADVLAADLDPCPCCGAKTWSNAGQVKDWSITGEWFDLKECTDCHLKMTFPQPGEQEIGRYYASTNYISHSDTKTGLINRLYHSARQFMLRKKLDWVKKASSLEKGTLLDVGAGTGHFAHFMKENGWQVTALEPDSSARNVAKDKLGLEIEPLEHLGQLKSQSFDVITLWHVLEHVRDIPGYMHHFRQLLKSTGTLIIAVPNHTSNDARRYGTTWAAYDVPRHLWHFSPASMEKLMARHAFKVTQKIPMPLDAFYVSMLSEKYDDNQTFGSIAGFISGLKTFFAENKNVNEASSIIYIVKPLA
jgi:ubiquinone/menaquinone biosynthesis C-methylase UbiE